MSASLCSILVLLSISILHAQDPALTGTWTSKTTKRLGKESEPLFQFLTLAADGRVTVSNGIDVLPCHARIGAGTLELQTTADNVWRGRPESDLLRGIYKVDDDGQLRIVVPPVGREGSFDPGALGAAYWDFTLEKVLEAQLASIGAAGREPGQQARLQHLARLGARFSTDQLGRVTDIDVTHASVTVDDLRPLTALPALKSLTVGLRGLAEDLAAVFPDHTVGPSRVGYEKQWQLRADSAAGRAFDAGRRLYAGLEPLPAASNPPPVFETVSPDGANAFLFPYRGKLYAVHPRLPGKLGQPNAMKHEKLRRPVPLGKPILERCGFLIRQFSGNPGPDWIYEPIPPEASVLFDGMHLKVCLPDRRIEAFVNVGKINGNDRIAPGSPVGERTVQGILIQNPGADLKALGGCPVIDARTGHLLGVVSHAENDTTESQFYLDPIHDLTRLPAKPAEYQHPSFFNLANGKLGRGEAAKLAGILPPDIMNLKFGVSDAAEFLHDRPNVLFLDREEFLGREYLLSTFKVQNGPGSPITLAHARADRVAIGDERVRPLAEFLLGRFGEPTEIEVSQPMQKTHERIGFIWRKPKGGVRLDLNYNEFENTLSVLLAFDAREEPRLESPFSGTKLPSRTFARSVLDDFLGHLAGLPQDPKPRITGMDVFRAMLEQ